MKNLHGRFGKVMLFFCLVSFLFCFVFLNFIIIAKVELKEKIIIFIRPCKLFLMVFLKPRGGGFLSRASTAGMRGAPLNTLPISSGSVQSPVAPAVTDETSRTKFTVFACAEEGGSYHNLNFSACHPSPPALFVLSAWEGWRAALVVTVVPWCC